MPGPCRATSGCSAKQHKLGGGCIDHQLEYFQPCSVAVGADVTCADVLHRALLRVMHGVALPQRQVLGPLDIIKREQMQAGTE